MELRDELLAEVGPKTHIAELCGRASDELLIKQMKIDQQQREIDRLREVIRPFVAGVFNDNGDVTVSSCPVTLDKIEAAYWALKRSEVKEPLADDAC